MKLDEIGKLIDAATPGEAGAHESGEYDPLPPYVVSRHEDSFAIGWFNRKSDAKLHAASRTLMPKLLAVVEAAKAGPCRHAHDRQTCPLCQALAALEGDGLSDLKPFSDEWWQRAFEKARDEAGSEGYQRPTNYVSPKRYQAAMDALERGASEREAMLILMGASPEVAKKMSEADDTPAGGGE